MTRCGECNKFLAEKTIAVKTKKVAGNLVVLESRQALVCDEHGVVAWDPPRNTPNYIPYVPYVPVTPNRPLPWNPNPWGGYPNTAWPSTTIKPTFTVWNNAAANPTISGTYRFMVTA